MKCIFCLDEKPASIEGEHIVPDAVGGQITIKEVCRECNSVLNQKIDEPFIKSDYATLVRYTLGIEGRRGDIPNFFGKISTEFNGEILKAYLDGGQPHIHPSISESQTTAGEKSVSIRVDTSNMEEVEKVVRKRLARDLKNQIESLPEGEREKALNQAVSQALRSGQREKVDSQYTRPIIFDPEGLELLALKIAYETAFRTFGYEYVESEAGRLLRSAILDSIDVAKFIKTRACDPNGYENVFTNHFDFFVALIENACIIRAFSIPVTVYFDRTGSFRVAPEDAKVLWLKGDDRKHVEVPLSDILSQAASNSILGTEK